MGFLWNLWWARQVASSVAHDFFYTDRLFHPFGVELVQHTHTAFNAMVACTILARLGLVPAYNALVLMAFTLNGYVTYHLIHDILRDRWAALVGAMCFQLSPFFLGQLVEGHANLVGAWGMPLCLLFYRRALDRVSLVLAGLAGISLAAVVYNDYYYAVYLLGATLAYPALRWWDIGLHLRSRKVPRDWIDVLALISLILIVALTLGIKIADLRSPDFVPVTIGEVTVVNIRTAGWVLIVVWLLRRWRPHVTAAPARTRTIGRDVAIVAVTLAVFLASVAPLAARTTQLWIRGDYVTAQFRWGYGPRGVDLASFVLGPPFHWLVGFRVQHVYQRFLVDPVEGAAWFGLVPLVLLGCAVAEIRRDSELRRWLWLGAGALLWALGPQLTVFGIKTGFILPQAILRHLPILSNARIPGRAIVIALLAAAVLAAAGAARLRMSRRRGLLLLLPIVIAAELVGGRLPMVPAEIPALYRRIPPGGRGAVLELPVGVRDGFGEEGSMNMRTLYYQTVHGRPLVGGFAARLPDRIKVGYRKLPVIASLLRLSAREALHPEEVDADRARGASALRALGIEFVVLDRSLAPPSLVAYVEDVLPLELVSREGQRDLYRVVEKPLEARALFEERR